MDVRPERGRARPSPVLLEVAGPAPATCARSLLLLLLSLLLVLLLLAHGPPPSRGRRRSPQRASHHRAGRRSRPCPHLGPWDGLIPGDLPHLSRQISCR